MSKVIFSSVPPNSSPHLECTYLRVRLSGLYFSIFAFLCAEIRISGAKAFTGGMVFGSLPAHPVDGAICGRRLLALWPPRAAFQLWTI